MIFEKQAVFVFSPDRPLSLREVWAIAAAELSPNAQAIQATLVGGDDQETINLHRAVAWACQAVLEFQDLQSLTLPVEGGRFSNQNYLFFEALSVLRESMVCGLNGSFHSSLSLLRTVQDLIIFHHYWRARFDNDTGEIEEFHRWLHAEQQSKQPTFKQAFNSCRDRLTTPDSWDILGDFYTSYQKLCAYVHKPLIYQSIVQQRGGNTDAADSGATKYWLRTCHDALLSMVGYLVAEYPATAFPVCIYRRFGFNIPVGAFFDEQNIIPVRVTIGEARYVEIAALHLTGTQCKELKHFYESQPELAPAEILATAGENMLIDESLPEEQQIIAAYCQAKLDVRVMSTMFSYSIFPMAVAGIAYKGSALVEKGKKLSNQSSEQHPR